MSASMPSVVRSDQRLSATLLASIALFSIAMVAGLCYSLVSRGSLPDVRLAYGAEVTERMEREGIAATIPELRLAAEIEYNQYQPVMRLYQAARDVGDRENQLFALERLVGRNQAHPALRAEYILLLLEHGRTAEAFHHASIEVRLHPDSPEAHCHLATASLILDRKQAALTHFRKALELNPRSEAARLGLEHPLLRGR